MAGLVTCIASLLFAAGMRLKARAAHLPFRKHERNDSGPVAIAAPVLQFRLVIAGAARPQY